MIGRREFLTGTAGYSLGAALSPAQAPQTANPSVVIVADPARPRPDITSVFGELGLPFRLVAADAVAGVQPDVCDLLWLVSPTYPEPSVLSPALVETIGQLLAAGKGVFAEFVTNFPDLPLSDRLRKSGVARLFVHRPLPVADALPAGTILEEHDSMFLPVSTEIQEAEVILAFGRVAGVRTILPGFRPETTWPGLLMGLRGPGRFALAVTSLSDFRRRQYAPLARWEPFLRQLVLTLLPEDTRDRVSKAFLPLRAYTEPRTWVQPGEKITVIAETGPGTKVTLAGAAPIALAEAAVGRYQAGWKAGAVGPVRLSLRAARGQRFRASEIGLYVAGRKAAYRRALERNIRWFERSGVLLKSDGTAGVAEWISGPDIDGNRNAFGAGQMFSPERADCVFQSGLAFSLYGKVAASRRHQAIGRHMLNRIMDFQRLEPADPGYGLWYTRGRGGPAFQDDTSWATVCALAGYRYTKEPHFLHRGLISAQAQLKAFGPDDRYRVPLNAHAGPGARITSKADDHPHNGGCVLSAWLYTYGMTSERVYLDTTVPMLVDMIAAFPKIPRYIISKTCESSRFLLPLSFAWAYTRDERFRRALDEHAAYLRSRMAPCGAIQEQGSNIAGRVQGGDLGLTYDQNETISDQLYCTSFASMNLWIAYKATGDKRYLEDFFRVTDYLVRIQIDSPDPAIDGGWMRGFDYSLWEYYGANADTAWTAYCMETGWQNAIIDIALALYLMDDSFYQPPGA
ncbi:MAG: hypothetical protein AAB225_06145 [Acidobacteriota bacterium]